MRLWRDCWKMRSRDEDGVNVQLGIMRCPTLAELPPPPPGKEGWPWTEGSPSLPDQMPDGRPWPRVSLVTPSYNQDPFIEETIRSVLLQGYPALEYIVIDGGSRDNSVEIIKKYERYLAYWVSEADRGQADAINKGFQRGTGELGCYLNSDDILCRGTLENAAKILSGNGRQEKWMCSRIQIYFEYKPERSFFWSANPRISFEKYLCGQSFGQQGVFWRLEAAKQIPFDPRYQFCLDHAFFAELFYRYGPPVLSDHLSAVFRLHRQSKSFTTLKDVWIKEANEICCLWNEKLPWFRALKLRYLWGLVVKTHRVLEISREIPKKGITSYGAELLKISLFYPRAVARRALLRAVAERAIRRMEGFFGRKPDTDRN